MIRFSSLFWLALVVLTGFAMFKVKYAVQDLEDELGRVRKQAVAEQQEIRVLNAEWSYLTQPERLAELNRRFFNLAPITPKQLEAGIDELPMRAEPVPEDVLVYALSDRPAPPAVPIAPAILSTTAPEPVVSALPAQAASPRPAAQLAKTAAARPRSLDELFVQISEGR